MKFSYQTDSVRVKVRSTYQNVFIAEGVVNFAPVVQF